MRLSKDDLGFVYILAGLFTAGSIIYGTKSCSANSDKNLCEEYGYIHGKTGYLKVFHSDSSIVVRESLEGNDNYALFYLNKNKVLVHDYWTSTSNKSTTDHNDNHDMTLSHYVNNLHIDPSDPKANERKLGEVKELYQKTFGPKLQK